jgi:hypothetical protein
VTGERRRQEGTVGPPPKPHLAVGSGAVRPGDLEPADPPSVETEADLHLVVLAHGPEPYER